MREAPQGEWKPERILELPSTRAKVCWNTPDRPGPLEVYAMRLFDESTALLAYMDLCSTQGLALMSLRDGVESVDHPRRTEVSVGQIALAVGSQQVWKSLSAKRRLCPVGSLRFW
jgi:hypothetical protein